MPGNALDVVLVALGVLCALSGYRQGFVVGSLSLVGFLGGGLLGARVAPAIAELELLRSVPRVVVGLLVVFAAAVLGQLLASLIATAVRRRLTWRPVRQLDAVGGAAVSVLSLLLVAWLVGRVVASSPSPSLASQVRRSVVITSVDALMPSAGLRFLGELQDLVDRRGFPEVFSDLRAVDASGVPAPDPRLATSDVVRGVERSVLKVTGLAQSCGRRLEGSGFVYAPERVMTNAHVVAGVRDPEVAVGATRLPARVVLFDPARDVAVLAVEGLDRPPLPVAPREAAPEDSALVVGYPQDGPFRPDPARIIGIQEAQGRDIYEQDSVVREIYALKGTVQQGNSGGPLVDPAGRVLGVVFAAAADDPSVGYALTWDEVDGPAQAAVGRSARVGTGTCS